jgi:PEP-CTERM motif
MRFSGLKDARFSFLAAGAALFGALGGAAQASVVTPTASLPLIGIPYVSPGAGAGCFVIATACVNPGPFIQTSVVSDTFSGGDQYIVADVTYDATLTPPGETNIIGSVSLTGTVDETVFSRTSNSETGTFAVDLTGLTLTGSLSLPGNPLNGRMLTVGLDPSDSSSGMTTIAPYGAEFKIYSFFDVFADITLDLPPPLTSPSTSVGPIFLVAVPEPSTWAMMLLGFAGLAFAAYRRPIHRRSSGAAAHPCG